MAREADHYTADEAARLLGLSPARVRQMLRSGELEGERREERVEGVLGPWRIPKGAVEALRERREAEEAEATAVLPAFEPATGAFSGAQGAGAPSPPGRTADTPSETSERLSEGVGELRRKAEELLGELERLEGRLEAAEVEQLALRESLDREKERADGLEAELRAEQARPGGEPPRGSPWRRLLGG